MHTIWLLRCILDTAHACQHVSKKIRPALTYKLRSSINQLHQQHVQALLNHSPSTVQADLYHSQQDSKNSDSISASCNANLRTAYGGMWLRRQAVFVRMITQ